MLELRLVDLEYVSCKYVATGYSSSNSEGAEEFIKPFLRPPVLVPVLDPVLDPDVG